MTAPAISAIPAHQRIARAIRRRPAETPGLLPPSWRRTGVRSRTREPQPVHGGPGTRYIKRITSTSADDRGEVKCPIQSSLMPSVSSCVTVHRSTFWTGSRMKTALRSPERSLRRLFPNGRAVSRSSSPRGGITTTGCLTRIHPREGLGLTWASASRFARTRQPLKALSSPWPLRSRPPSRSSSCSSPGIDALPN